jgi:hypothetical protein
MHRLANEVLSLGDAVPGRPGRQYGYTEDGEEMDTAAVYAAVVRYDGHIRDGADVARTDHQYAAIGLAVDHGLLTTSGDYAEALFVLVKAGFGVGEIFAVTEAAA